MIQHFLANPVWWTMIGVYALLFLKGGWDKWRHSRAMEDARWQHDRNR
jgi:hypothetical protein